MLSLPQHRTRAIRITTLTARVRCCGKLSMTFFFRYAAV
jgi:hypothetical protein